MGNKIFIICNFYSIQVWSAIKLHINYISKAGGVPVLIIKKVVQALILMNLKALKFGNIQIYSLFLCIF